ncbi:MAG TPA: 5-formyltetrahydrofolate cyclo-ligase [Candidatus Eisenbacteria bacterium]|nr:5-formyltetrahydrofolate cyclo-ligase [Candidatus Eisenbacteria bacterium]
MSGKEAIRQRIWALLEAKKAARFPGAVGRIPNFIGAEACARRLTDLPAWRSARVLKVNPDSPQRPIRQKALEEGKVIYMAVPRLRSDKPFIALDPEKLKCSPRAASSIEGASKHGRPVKLEEVKPIDLVVCGSVAVNRRGGRVGKGGGYSDLEFALLVEEGKIASRTQVVTSVHPLQLVDDDLPMTVHDIPLSVIVTPEEIIKAEKTLRRPQGIYWDMLPAEKIEAIPVLKARQARRTR